MSAIFWTGLTGFKPGLPKRCALLFLQAAHIRPFAWSPVNNGVIYDSLRLELDESGT